MEVLATTKNVLRTAKDVGHFVLDRLQGGAWGDIVPEEPVHANITYYEGPQDELPPR